MIGYKIIFNNTFMKNFFTKTNSIFLSLIVVLFLLFVLLFYKVYKVEKIHAIYCTYAEGDSISTNHLPIAYVNTDSLLLNYELANESNEALMKREEDARLELNSKARQLQSEMAEFQRKLENNAFLSRERAEQEQKRLIKKEEDLQQRNNKLSQELLEAQQKVGEELRDSIYSYLKEFNKNRKFEMILSNTGNDNIMIANTAYDITKEITDGLNKRYSKRK